MKMKVLVAVSGRSLKPRTACCAATRTLVVLTAILRSKLSTVNVFEDSDRGSSPSTGDAVAAKERELYSSWTLYTIYRCISRHWVCRQLS